MQARHFCQLVRDTNFPFVRLIKAVQGTQERRFASTIFTQKSV